jgi:hypothetical protein
MHAVDYGVADLAVRVADDHEVGLGIDRREHGRRVLRTGAGVG